MGVDRPRPVADTRHRLDHFRSQTLRGLFHRLTIRRGPVTTPRHPNNRRDGQATGVTVSQAPVSAETSAAWMTS
jgi:hypothetical protein